MKRRTFHIIAAGVWLLALLSVGIYYDSLYSFSQKAFSDLGGAAFPTLIFSLVVVGSFLHGYLADTYAPKEVKFRKLMTPEEKKEQTVRDAELARKQGRLGAAFLIYEESGMYEEALKIAEKIPDKFGMARLYFRMGLYGSARRLHLEMQDYEAAAHTSILMDQFDTAREYYRKAAEKCKEREALSEEGGLWERAGERKKAAEVYEEAGEMERAAECYQLLGDARNAERCGRQARAVEAFERKQRGTTRGQWERQIELRKEAALEQARKLKEISDFFAAGLLFREAGEMLEAAQCFEKFQEWERAADAYEKAGLPERAEFARMNIPPKEPVAEEEAAAAQVAPVPKTDFSSAFTPIAHAQAVPVYLAAAGLAPVSPETRLNVCRRVRRGNFLEAAEFAKEAGDWLMAAAYYEHAHQYVPAADIYRQIGDITAASWCLEKAGRFREAALLALGIGKNERVVEILLNAINAGNEVEENGLTLGELLIKWGKHKMAVDLLRTRIGEGEINESNAGAYYKFARMLEDHKAWKEAHVLYRALLDAGAESNEISEREARLAARLKEAPEIEAAEREEIEPTEPDKIDSMMAAATEAFTKRPRKSWKHAPEEAGSEKTFAFVHATEPMATGDADLYSVETGAFLRPDFSLFGHAVGDDALLKTEETKGAPSGAAPGEDESSLFQPSRRYVKKAEIGRGGMGIVYHTHDTLLDRPVALKLILDELADSGAFQQFLIEARAVAVLSHPNVITIYDIGLMGLRHYIAMEFVDGPGLGKLIREERALPLKEALRIFIEMSRGLKAAHDAGVVHRDIKPDNVLLTKEHQVKIGDFGLARMRKKPDAKRDPDALEISGTPGFMPPEQIRGAEPHPACDIYALGITLFTMLVGRPPTAIAKRTTLREMLEFQESTDWPALRSLCPDVPESLERVYQYCVEPNPGKRYRSIDTFLSCVEDLYESL